MHITADSDWARHALHVRLFHQHFTALLCQGFHLPFTRGRSRGRGGGGKRRGEEGDADDALVSACARQFSGERRGDGRCASIRVNTTRCFQSVLGLLSATNCQKLEKNRIFHFSRAGALVGRQHNSRKRQSLSATCKRCCTRRACSSSLQMCAGPLEASTSSCAWENERKRKIQKRESGVDTRHAGRHAPGLPRAYSPPLNWQFVRPHPSRLQMLLLPYLETVK